MLVLAKTTAALYGVLLRDGVVLNLPQHIADRLIQSGHVVPWEERASPENPRRPAPKRTKKEA